MISELSSKDINRAGEDLIDQVTKMYSSLTNIKNLVEGSKSFFNSPAGDSVRTSFNASAEKFENFRSEFNSYGEYLKTFAGNVEKYEEAVKEAASEFPI